MRVCRSRFCPRASSPVIGQTMEDDRENEEVVQDGRGEKETDSA